MDNHPLSNAWIVFSHAGRELLRLTAGEATASEVLETCGLLARERRCSEADIDITLDEAASSGDWPPAVPPCFFDYWNTASYLLELVFALSLHDAGVESAEIAAAQKAGETPVQYVTWFARKHDLTPVNHWGAGQAHALLSRFAPSSDQAP